MMYGRDCSVCVVIAPVMSSDMEVTVSGPGDGSAILSAFVFCSLA